MVDTDETGRIELNSYTNYAIVINNNSVVFVDKRDEERKIIIKSGNSDWSIYYENDNDEYNDDDISVISYDFIAKQAEADDGE